MISCYCKDWRWFPFSPWRLLLSHLTTRPYRFGQIITAAFTCGSFWIKQLNLFCCVVFLKTGSYVARAKTMFYVADDYFELSILLPPPECWYYRHVLPSLVYVVLGIKYRDLCILGKLSESYTTYPQPVSVDMVIIRCGSSQTWNKSISNTRKHIDKSDIIKNFWALFCLNITKKAKQKPTGEENICILFDGVASTVCIRTFVTQQQKCGPVKKQKIWVDVSQSEDSTDGP